MTGSLRVLSMAGLFMVATIGAADAQVAREGGGASAQLVQQMQQMASERTGLQAENAKLKKDLEAMRKERDSLKNAQAGLEKRARASESALKSMHDNSAAHRDAAEQDLAHAKDKLQELLGKYRELTATLGGVEQDNANNRQLLATREQELRLCGDHNAALYKLNDEVLTRLGKQGFWGGLARAEPFTQIKRTELENMTYEYKSRAEDLKSQPPSPPPPQTPSATPVQSH